MKRIYLLALVMLIAWNIHATHNYGGEITYNHISGGTYEVTVQIYDDPTSPAMRDSLELILFDVNNDEVLRQYAHRTATMSYSFLNASKFVTSITLNTSGIYYFSVTDPGRTNGINNISGSINVPLYLQAMINYDAADPENSPQFNTISPISIKANNTAHISHAAYDPDGNCLKYELLVPKQDFVTDVPGYNFPDDPQLNPPNAIFDLDEVSGDIKVLLQNLGLYSYAVRVSEWKDGQLMGYVVRDVVISVSNSNNTVIFDSLSSWNLNAAGVHEYTVLPGNTLSLDLLFRDNDNSTNQTLESFGEVYNISNAATFTVNNISADEEYGTFTWTPAAADQRSTPYVVNFRGTAPSVGNVVLQEEITLVIYTQNNKADCSNLNVGIKEISEGVTKVYPNPFTHSATIELERPLSNNAQIRITDISGKIILLEDSSGMQKIIIENKGYAPGVYFYTIIDNGTNISGKIIVQ